MAKVVAISNNKGGVGKTFFAVHLAWIFANKGYKTLLMDCDTAQGDAMKWISGYQLQDPDLNKVYRIGENLNAVLVDGRVKVDRGGWDYIVVDGRPDVVVFGKIAEADVIIVPIEGRLSQENADEIMRTLSDMQGKKKVIVVANKVLKGTRLCMREFKMCRDRGWHLYGDVIPQYSYVRIAEEKGIPVWKVPGAYKSYVEIVFRSLTTVIEEL